MSLGVCIPDLAEQGKLPKQKAKAILARYERMVAAREGRMSRAAAEAEATAKLVKLLEEEATEKKRRTLLQAKNQLDWQARMVREGEPVDVAAMKRELEGMEYRIKAVYGDMMADFDEFLRENRRNILGQQPNPAELDDIVRELWGVDTGNANARTVAKAMQEQMERARLRRNRAGGNTRKLDGYAGPQSHNSKLVRELTFEQWAARPEIERARVRDVDLDEWADGARRVEILRAAYQNIVTDGAETLKPGSVGIGSMANARQDPRVIHFASPDDWMSYARDLGGNTNIYDIFTSHMRNMAKEIVMMEDMGPNPMATLRYRQDWIEKTYKLHGSDFQRGSWRLQKKLMMARFDTVSGAANVPDSETVAKVMGAVRSWEVAAKLGSAPLSAITDFGTMIHRAGYNNLPVARMLKAYTEFVTDSGGLHAEQAIRLGLVMDEFIGRQMASYREGALELTGSKIGTMADSVMRLSGLTRHTRAGQWAFSREMVAFLTDQRMQGFDALPPGMQRMFKRYGMGAAEWDAYRATPTIEDGGATWIVPRDAGEVGEKVAGMLRQETDIAVLMPDLGTRSALAWAKPGSFGGEALRTVLLFKSFPLTMLFRTIEELKMVPGGGWGKVAYGSSFMAIMTAFGGLSLILQDLRSGRDPRQAFKANGMPDAGFWGQAAAQGGGLGILGDLIKSTENRYGGGPLGTVAGPVLGTLAGIGTDIAANVKASMDDNPETESHWMRDGLRTLAREVPGSSLWYTRLALERTVGDWIMGLAEPDRRGADQRQYKYAEDIGTSFYAKPGVLYGDGDWRLPDWSNAIGQPSAPENVERQAVQ